jgi:putative SOS response-associated peptidase YedK
MCGRYAITSAPEAIRRLFGYVEQPNFPPRYNVAPTQPIPIVRLVDGKRRFALVRWGLVPSWVKDPKAFALLINARGESVNDKPAFRNAMKYRRCLIPADGFYDWQRQGKGGRPFYVSRKGGGPFAFAGLWETWSGPNGEEMESAAIVTTGASRLIAHIHERMPVMLEPEAFDLWLDCGKVDAQTASVLIAPAREDRLQLHEVSVAVNAVANDDASLIEPPPPQVAAVGATPMEDQAPTRKRRAKKDDGQPSLF